MSKAKAIVLVTTSFLPISANGSEAAGSFVSDLADELVKHVPVRVVAPGPEATQSTSSSGVEVFRYAAPPLRLSTLKPWHPKGLTQVISVLREGAAATARAVSAGPTAHVLAMWALPSGHWARVVSRQTGVRYSVWTLGSDIWELGRIPLVRQYLGHVLRGATHCYSDGLQLAEDTRRIGKREVEFLPSTRRIEGRRTAPLKDAPPYRLVFLGRWHPNKGIDLLLDALALLTEADWQRISVVDICGGGTLAGAEKDMEVRVRAGVELLRKAGRPVELPGFLDKPAAEAAILRADYLVIPSRIESIPVVFSDAMKLGCPVICTPVGDLPALLAEGSVGICAHRADSASLADALRQALGTPPSTFGEQTQLMAERFSLDTAAKTCIRDLGGN